MKRIECGADAAPDRSGGLRGQLLPADNGCKTGEARFASAQGRNPGNIHDGAKTRIETNQRVNRVVEVGLRVEMNCHLVRTWSESSAGANVSRFWDQGRTMPLPVFRFAPSPNGFLHLGHARSALLNFDLARRSGGRMLLRIEDIDTVRCRPEYEQAIYEDLAWLGISWEEPVRRQSEHLALYRNAVDRLAHDGLIYPAFESRAEIARMVDDKERSGAWPRDPDGAPIYPGAGRRVTEAERAQRIRAGAPYALRLDMIAAIARAGPLSWTEQGKGPEGETGEVPARSEQWGDVILARKDTPTSYHLSVVIDDALQGVTQVVRGQDLFWATGVHRLLQELLGLPQPVYSHHALVLDEAGQKLSKSTQSTALRELRADGTTLAEIRRLVGVEGA
jgi:glutamyl-Q tRNA(Asp) synthetase